MRALIKALIFVYCLSPVFEAHAQIAPFPYMPVPTSPMFIYPPYNTYSSLEQMRDDLVNQASQLSSSLADTKAKVQAIDTILNAEASLKLKWVDATKRDTASDLHVMLGNKQITLCQSRFLSGTHPGVLTAGGCLVTYGGDSLIRQEYKVLQGNVALNWQKANVYSDYQFNQAQNPGNQSSNVWTAKTLPVAGGYEKGSILYFCLAAYNNQNYIGKTIADNCNIAVNGKEIVLKDFTVLFANKP